VIGRSGTYLGLAVVVLAMGARRIAQWNSDGGTYDLVMGLLLIASVPVWLIAWKRTRTGA